MGSGGWSRGSAADTLLPRLARGGDVSHQTMTPRHIERRGLKGSRYENDDNGQSKKRKNQPHPQSIENPLQAVILNKQIKLFKPANLKQDLRGQEKRLVSTSQFIQSNTFC